jgi:O-acetyl-ADP-ribose deacetylase (regulator of RNase III)
MKVKINQTIIELQQGDITKQDVDAIVNAANSTLLGGGGVDGAIHRAAGRKLIQECMTLNGCHTGDAKITKGYNLTARYVIHAVGPIYRNNANAANLLASAYQRSLEVAHEYDVRTIAFPAISTGVYGYPLREASQVALETLRDFALNNTSIDHMIIVLFTADAYEVFSDTFKTMFES